MPYFQSSRDSAVFNSRKALNLIGGFSAQDVWGRGQTWRLTQMWYQQKFLDQKLGRFGEGEDFNSFPCDFQNLAFCGSQVGNWVGGIWKPNTAPNSITACTSRTG